MKGLSPRVSIRLDRVESMGGGVEGPVGISAADVAGLVGSGRVAWAVVRKDVM